MERVDGIVRFGLLPGGGSTENRLTVHWIAGWFPHRKHCLGRDQDPAPVGQRSEAAPKEGPAAPKVEAEESSESSSTSSEEEGESSSQKASGGPKAAPKAEAAPKAKEEVSAGPKAAPKVEAAPKAKEPAEVRPVPKAEAVPETKGSSEPSERAQTKPPAGKPSRKSASKPKPQSPAVGADAARNPKKVLKVHGKVLKRNAASKAKATQRPAVSGDAARDLPRKLRRNLPGRNQKCRRQAPARPRFQCLSLQQAEGRLYVRRREA
eukprot:s3207_g6.t1